MADIPNGCPRRLPYPRRKEKQLPSWTRCSPSLVLGEGGVVGWGAAQILLHRELPWVISPKSFSLLSVKPTDIG